MRIKMKVIIYILTFSVLCLNAFSKSNYGEAFEIVLLEHYDTQAVLYHIDDQANNNRCVWIGVHGINDSPKRILTLKSLYPNCAIKVLAYDDQTSRLGPISNILKEELKDLKNKYEVIHIDGHSMGARISLHAVNQFDPQSSLVKLNLLSPHLIGLRSSNIAKTAIWPFSLLPKVKPGKDMASASRFQKELNSITLSNKVDISVYSGGNDWQISHSSDKFKNYIKMINAYWEHYPNEDHNTVITRFLKEKTKK